MLDLHVHKAIAYLIESVVLFLYPSYFPIDSIREVATLEGVIMEIFSCLLDTFSCAWESFYVNLIVFAIYVKNS